MPSGLPLAGQHVGGLKKAEAKILRPLPDGRLTYAQVAVSVG